MDTRNSKMATEIIPQVVRAENSASVTDSHNGFNGYREESGLMSHMPVAKDSYKYKMNHPNRGKAVVFNHKRFTNGQPLRLGTEKDVQKLCRCLASLAFDYAVYDDLRKEQIFTVLESLKKEDHSKSDCLVVIVLSHGDQDRIFCADADYRPEDLWNPFTAEQCPSLAGKPKIFFIQACRGEKLDSGTKLVRTQTDSLPLPSECQNIRYVPNCEDFLVVYSTAPGYVSWRSQQEGTYFIQALTSVLKEYQEFRDLLSMMTIVARKVALDFESNTEDRQTDHKKQMPLISSTLRRDIFFW